MFGKCGLNVYRVSHARYRATLAFVLTCAVGAIALMDTIFLSQFPAGRERTFGTVIVVAIFAYLPTQAVCLRRYCQRHFDAHFRSLTRLRGDP